MAEIIIIDNVQYTVVDNGYAGVGVVENSGEFFACDFRLDTPVLSDSHDTFDAAVDTALGME